MSKYEEYPVPVKTGQKRQFNESGREFVVGKLKYDDRDFYECHMADGTVETHSEIIILCRSNIIEDWWYHEKASNQLGSLFFVNNYWHNKSIDI